MKVKLPKIIPAIKWDKHIPVIIFIFLTLCGASFFSYRKISSLKVFIQNLTDEKDKNIEELQKIAKELEELKNQDQLKINNELQFQIQNIEKSYDKAVSIYEELLDLKSKTKETKTLDELFSKSLSQLSKRDYEEANRILLELSSKIKEEETKIANSFSISPNIPAQNTPPNSGYSRQQVQTNVGTFLVSLIAADLGSTKVIVDTASESNCSNNCPTIPLATFVARNGAYAGINGTYFCPTEYPSCSGKTNSFDLLVMNYKKIYFNSENNVYSNNPVVVFGDQYIRFIEKASQWGRDTSPNGVLSNFPLLVFNGEIKFGGDNDPKKGSKGGRSFVANKGNDVYIGVVHNATVVESARVLKTLGMENAMNLDDGGSTALWFGGYKVGPGRNLSNAILFVKK